MQAVRSGFFIVLMCLACCPVANAFVGELDKENRFPFVVRLNSSVGSCSGVAAYNGIVATAAHCVWNEDGLARNMTIAFVDATGRSGKANAVRIFMPEEFKQLYAKYKAGQSAAILTSQDIAFVIPDRVVEPIGYPHWVTEILVSNAAETDVDFFILGSLEGLNNWTPSLRQRLDDAIKKNFGSLNSARSVAVGFGNFLCKNYEARQSTCISDERNRSGQIPLDASAEIEGLKAPWIWCTGRDVAGINPIQHGDSGGPVFVRALDGRWLFVGFTSNGGPAQSCASSILSHLALFAEAANWFEEFTSARGGFDHSAAWREAQIKRFLEEFFESWSSPNEEAILRLQTFYLSSLSFYGKRRTFAEILREKQQFAERWPQRNYHIRPGTVEVLCNEHVPDKFCSAIVEVDWSVANPISGASRRGKSRYEFELNVWNLHHGYGGDRRDFDPGVGFPPHIMSETGSTLNRK